MKYFYDGKQVFLVNKNADSWIVKDETGNFYKVEESDLDKELEKFELRGRILKNSISCISQHQLGLLLRFTF
jgi:hypothetical protein